MQLAFEIAQTFAGRAIGWWTKSQYDHVELCFDRINAPDGKRMFSSTFKTGVRFADFPVTDPRQWTLVTLPVSVEQERQAYEYAKALVGQKYDWRGIAEFVFRNLNCDPHEKFCSEVVMTVLQRIGLFPGQPADQVYPGFLYLEARAMNA